MTDERRRRIARDVVHAIGANLDVSPYATVGVSEEFMAATPDAPPIDLKEAKARHLKLQQAVERGDESAISWVADKALGVLGKLF